MLLLLYKACSCAHVTVTATAKALASAGLKDFDLQHTAVTPKMLIRMLHSELSTELLGSSCGRHHMLYCPQHAVPTVQKTYPDITVASRL
jgi:hypothetical protein